MSKKNVSAISEHRSRLRKAVKHLTFWSAFLLVTWAYFMIAMMTLIFPYSPEFIMYNAPEFNLRFKQLVTGFIEHQRILGTAATILYVYIRALLFLLLRKINRNWGGTSRS